MKATKRKRTWATRFSVSGLSIQQRLPLLICLLLLCVVVIFSWTAYIGVKDASLKAGRERLMSLTGQLSSLFQQSAHVTTTATHTAATQESILDYLRSDGKQSRDETIAAMRKLRQDTIFRLVELLNADRAPVLRFGDTGFVIKANLRPVLQAAATSAEFTSIGKIYRAGDSMYYPIVAAVMDEKKPLGYIVRWRLLHATPQAIAQLSALIGTKATLYVGNDDGSLWTDMIKPVSNPPINNLHQPDPVRIFPEWRSNYCRGAPDSQYPLDSPD